MVKTRKYVLLLAAVLMAICIAVGAVFLLPRAETTTASAEQEYTVVEPGGVYDANALLVIDDNGKWTGVQGEWPGNANRPVHVILPIRVASIGFVENYSVFNLRGKYIAKVTFEDEANSRFTGVDASPDNRSVFDASLNSIIFPANNRHQTIGAYSFFETSGSITVVATQNGLQHVEFGTNAGVEIGSYAFANCFGLRSVDYTGTGTLTGTSTIGDHAFAGDNQLYRAIFPGNLTTIGERAFSDDANGRSAVMLTDLAIGDNVTSIGSYAFANSGLVRFTVPRALTTIRNDSFTGCTKIVEVEDHSSIASATISRAFQSAMRIYTSGSSQLIRTADGLVFYQNPASGGRSGALSGNVNYQANRWYLAAYTDVYEHQYVMNQLLLELPDALSASTPRWRTKYSNEYYTDTWHANEEYDYVDASGTPHKNDSATPSGTVNSYDIGVSAFDGLWMPYIKISDAVVNIGNNAFNGSHVSSVVLGENVAAIGSNAFQSFGSGLYDNRGPVRGLYIYMPSMAGKTIQHANDSFVMGVSWAPTQDNWPATFVFKNKADHDATTRTLWGVSGSVRSTSYTYLMNVNYHVMENGEEIATQTVERLHGVPYNTVRNRIDTDTRSYPNMWGADSSVSALPNINEFEGVGNLYSSTVWYQASGDNSFGNQTSYSGVNTLLTGNNDLSQIDLYANKVDVPTLRDITRPYEEGTHTIQEITGLSEAEDAPYNVSMRFINFENESSPKAGINDAGVYTITVTLNPAWGVWAGASKRTMTVTVNKAEINLRDSDNLAWQATDNAGDSVAMQSGVLYVSGLNRVELSEFNGATQINVTESYARYLNNRSISVMIRVGDARYEIDYTRNNAATDVGSYSTNAVLTPTANYRFVVEGEEDGRHGVSVIVNADGTATVSKTWYIVRASNWVVEDGATLDDNTPDFSLFDGDGWVYGDTSVTFREPALRYGAKTEILFTLLRNGQVVGDAENLQVWQNDTTSLFAQYFNSSMPAGEYTLTINVPQITTAESTYLPIERTRRFTVSPRELTAEERQIVTNALSGTFEYLHDGNVHLWEGGFGALIESDQNGRTAETFAALTALLQNREDGSAWHVERQGIWANGDYNELYVPARLTYNLYRMQNNDYVTADYFNAERNTLLKDVNVYTVYYQFSASSYISMVDVTTDARRGSYFSVVIYRTLNVPAYESELTYTGSRRTPYIASNENYAVEWMESDADAYVHARALVGGSLQPISHEIVLSSYNSNLSRWDLSSIPEGLGDKVRLDESDPARLILTFEITPAQNRWSTEPRIIAWSWGSFDAGINRIVAMPYYGYEGVTFSIYPRTIEGSDVSYGNAVEFVNENRETVTSFSLTADGDLPDWVARVLEDFDAGNYELRATVPENADYTGLSEASGAFPFSVAKASNRWRETPNVMRWYWNQFDSEVNLITAAPLFTADDRTQTVHFAVLDAQRRVYAGLGDFVTDANGVVLTAGIADILKALPRGNYFLRASYGDTSNFNAIPDTDVPFEVWQALNYWEPAPALTGWEYRTFTSDTNFIEGVAHFNENNAQVTYALFDRRPAATETPVDGLRTFTDVAQVEDYLVELPANTYWLLAVVEGTNDYTSVRSAVSFAVRRAGVNAWLTPPSITGWRHHAFESALFVEGHATYGDLLYSVSVYDGDAVADYTALSYEALSAKLNDLPAGDYVLNVYTAEESANYVSATSDLRFTVSNLANMWIDLPVIEGWSTEFEPNEPMGTVEYGEIVYTYRTKDGQELEGKPLTEGTYILCATVELDGYETLYAEYEFTITPAFDTTLLIVNIVLASIMCALTVVVIIFAIRRNKEC